MQPARDLGPDGRDVENGPEDESQGWRVVIRDPRGLVVRELLTQVEVTAQETYRQWCLSTENGFTIDLVKE